jgi:ethanolamine ammonia-lyase small subunit
MSDAPIAPDMNAPSADPWVGLKKFTAARIALGRSGTSVPLREALAFRLAHAHARDAVYSVLEAEHLLAGLAELGVTSEQIKSQAKDRQEYLQRPDLGRRVDEKSSTQLAEAPGEGCDVVIVLADGLSATAINDHALPLLRLLLPQLREAGFRVGPVAVAEQARVALGDEVGHLLQAKLVLMLIGERPGLSSPNSLGAYLTYGPKIGLTDEVRNCVSNIRPEGLAYPAAAAKVFYLINEALQRKLSGVGLKDEHELLDE